ncbi:MAG TPA: protocatechuate 3,4-dioxygenase subunit alpha [Kofleriaceae bacterium]|jgi:protocatechuate 3,4-dioxygenase alpha subunit|nr:protocatechuate 3,4-dioxygenase subunit alpha [Kofleriaceae bacterium]
MRPVTPSQTIGPFWHSLADAALADLTRCGATGSRLALTGRVLDGSGAPVDDACIEIWQATPLASPEFPGWGRCATDAQGGFRFVTLAPDASAPYLAVAILARGLVKPLWTRVYFADAGDPLLARLPPARRATLLAQPQADGWHWFIRLQGDGETVFLDL